jgi:hypothetical protein
MVSFLIPIIYILLPDSYSGTLTAYCSCRKRMAFVQRLFSSAHQVRGSPDIQYCLEAAFSNRVPGQTS